VVSLARIRRLRPVTVLVDLVIVLVLGFLAVATLYPFLYELTVSLSTPAAVQQGGLQFFPLHPILTAYQDVLSQSGILPAYANTILRTVGATTLSVVLTAMIAYPLAQPDFPHRRAINFLFLFSMLFSGGFIPLFLLVKNLGLLDSRWSLVLPAAVTAMNVIIMRNFFQAIPRELIESAKIDGAGEFRTLLRIILPVSRPVLAVITLWVALSNWNAWFDALIYISSPDKQVLQVFIRNTVVTQQSPLLTGVMSNAQQTPAAESLAAAAVMVSTLPILALYPFLQKHFTRGLLLGSVKG
jgi:putative aldouronate transport system permease protein